MYNKINSKSNLNKKVPVTVFNYIEKHFPNAILSEIEIECDENFEILFCMNINFENIIYELKFNSDGDLIFIDSLIMSELFEEGYGQKLAEL